MLNQEQVKRQIITLLDLLPSERLEEVKDFVTFLQLRSTRRSSTYAPVLLAGLWRDAKVSDEDITEVRKEMWQRFGEVD